MTFVAAGCSGTDRVDVTTVLARDNCQTTDTGVKEIDYATLAAYRGTHLLELTEAPQADPHPIHLVAIVPGEYPTAGYSLKIGAEPTIEHGALVIAVKVDKPGAGAVLAQMVTRPCLVVGVADPRVDHVRVVDAEGHPIGELALAPVKPS